MTARPAEREPPVPGHAEFTFCDQSIERTFAWLDQNRRMSKDYERLAETSEAFIYVAMSRLMVRRLARL
ncbi:MAG: transposase [Actinomycetota bacterium]|nr:transposase [Actinomycetota bacterium]